ncbi:FMN-binding negative transcriptional regulator [Paraburkholderia acidicola]|uniref:FMN-binding negative transcriptional regulator n=1 Tax=Paraburkholderia acidicola TaxID=1912599 RepID=A0ABV1LLA4_9BURK
MYIPAHFAVPDAEALHRMIREHPLGILIASTPGGLDANHIPFELTPDEGEHGTLRAHVARSNPIWQDVKDGDEVMVVFRGEEAYVSPTWFPSKHEFHKQVPTWNYKVVHLHGKIRIRDDERFVRGMVARLTRTHEASLPKPWKMSDAPADYIDTMLKAIVGIEIEVTRITGKFKLSQNRELRDRLSLGEALKAQGDVAMGQATLDAIGDAKA